MMNICSSSMKSDVTVHLYLAFNWILISHCFNLATCSCFWMLVYLKHLLLVWERNKEERSKWKKSLMVFKERESACEILPRDLIGKLWYDRKKRGSLPLTFGSSWKIHIKTGYFVVNKDQVQGFSLQRKWILFRDWRKRPASFQNGSKE
jgi:hypothetical protein